MTERVKLVVGVPESHVGAVREALGKAGAGHIGNYSFCSFSVKGVGRFKPEVGAQPAIGGLGRLEEVAEERIEVTCDREQLEGAIAAVRAIHPYEEPVIDLYPMAAPGYPEP